jgi:hypothetical protein
LVLSSMYYTHLTYQHPGKVHYTILDFKLSPCLEYSMSSFR